MARGEGASPHLCAGPDTPLDVQGFDYNTQNYDQWHAQVRCQSSTSLGVCVGVPCQF
jgi:hypothetical protein